MTEQEHTAGQDGDSRQPGSRSGSNQDGSGQRGRHSWGSKAAKAPRKDEGAAPDRSTDASERVERDRSSSGSLSERPASTSSADRRSDSPEAGIRGAGDEGRPAGGFSGRSSEGRPAGGRSPWKGQSDTRGADRREGKPAWKGRSDDRPTEGQGGRTERPAQGGFQRDRPASGRDARSTPGRDGGQGGRRNDTGGRDTGQSAPRSYGRPDRGTDEGRGAQLRGAASRGGSASGSAADKQSRFGGRGGATSDRTSGSERPWQSRSSSPEGRTSGPRTSSDRSDSFRRPSDRNERGAGGFRSGDDRRGGGRPDEASSAGPRTHNARDLRSANRPDRERSPEIDEDVKGDELDRVTRAQVRNLEERSALWVSKHLVMAGRLLDIDPELAFQHALAASRRGGRLAAVREAVGLTAYAAGHYGEALREFRTFRRISGSNVHLPVMADCERGLGRPDRALDLARSEEAESLDAAGKAELAMVISGARADLGQLDAAVSALEIPQLDLHRAFAFSPRLFRAYADALDAVGRSDQSDKWRRQARVAEKALGLDDDLEPDIIDLGEDDEPVSSPVPRVADLLGTPAPSEDGPVGGSASKGGEQPIEPAAAEQRRGEPLQQAPLGGHGGERPSEESGDEGTAPDAGDAEVSGEPAVLGDADRPEASEPNLVGGMSLDLEADLEQLGEGRVADDMPESHSSEDGHDDAPKVEPEEEPEATSQDERAIALPADASPEGGSPTPVEPLQTEMLFSMDGSGSADIDSSDDAPTKVAADTTRRTSFTPAVEFSEGEVRADPTKSNRATVMPGKGSTPATEATQTSGKIADAPAEKAPKRKRSPKAEPVQEDVVDE